MKKFLTVMTMLFAASQAHAEVGSLLGAAKDYGLPCAVAIGAGLVFMKSDGMAVGGTVCAAAITVTAIQNSKKQNMTLSSDEEKRIDDKVGSAVAESEKKMSLELDRRDSKFDDMKKLLRELLSERMVALEEDLRADLKKQMSRPEFMETLERKVNERIKSEVITEGKSRKNEIVEQCVEEVIKSVVEKPIPVPADAPVAPAKTK